MCSFVQTFVSFVVCFCYSKNKSPAAWAGLLEDFFSYTLNDDPQPQVLFTFGFSNLKPAPSSVST